MNMQNETESTNVPMRICDHCASATILSEQVGTQNGDNVCPSCAESDYRHCDNCTVLVRRTNIMSGNGATGVCAECVDNDYRTCDTCGIYVHEGNVNWDGDDGLCLSCYETANEDHDSIPWRSWRRTSDFQSDDTGAIVQSKRKYGIELETRYNDEDDAIKVVNEIPNQIGIESDGSINGNGIEFQTPILQGKEGEKLVKALCKSLNDNDFFVDKSTGFHLHLDGAGLKKAEDIVVPPDEELKLNIYGFDDYSSREQNKVLATARKNWINNEMYVNTDKIKHLWCFYLAFEDVIMSFLPRSRRTNSYCLPLRTDYHMQEIANADGTTGLEMVWYRVASEMQASDRKRNNKDSTRYRGINIHALLAMNHLEVRFHSGTISARKILEWINLHTAIMDQCFNNRMNYEKLKLLSSETDLVSKTKVFFGMLDLPKTSENYFRMRQEKFCPNITFEPMEKVEHEEITRELAEVEA